MSYSFSARAPTKVEALLKVSDELAKVCLAQPVHKYDSSQALHAAEAFVHILPDDDARDVLVNVSGSLSWDLRDGREFITSANVNVSASLAQRR